MVFDFWLKFVILYVHYHVLNNKMIYAPIQLLLKRIVLYIHIWLCYEYEKNVFLKLYAYQSGRDSRQEALQIPTIDLAGGLRFGELFL